MNAKLSAVDQWLKSLEPHSYSRLLLIPSTIVIALMLPWALGDCLGIGFRAPLGLSSWPASAPFVAFSFIGVATTLRTRNPLTTKLGMFLWHALAVAVFVTPIVFFVWFAYGMRDH